MLNDPCPRPSLDRRQFSRALSAAAACGLGSSLAPGLAGAAGDEFQLRYLLGSCLYGYAPLAEIVAEVPKTGATAIDLWPMVHGNQREQLDQLGESAFAELLERHDVALGCITQYKLGPFGLQDEMRLAQRLGCATIVTGAEGPKHLSGSELKAAVAEFVEKMNPHLEVAEQTGVTIAIENHRNNLISSPESLKWLAELSDGRPLAIALTPSHLPQDERRIAELIRALADRIAVFYAWQRGADFMNKLPKDQEMLQMPGRGELDFKPIIEALAQIKYRGWTEIFMHPFPRGIPIRETTAEVTAEINRARRYLEKFT